MLPKITDTADINEQCKAHFNLEDAAQELEDFERSYATKRQILIDALNVAELRYHKAMEGH